MTDTTTIRLKDNIIGLIRTSKRCKNRLVLALDIGSSTIYKLLDRNDILFTTEVAQQIIAEELNIPREELLTEEA